MQIHQPRCPKCGGDMEQGYLLEFGQGCFFQASWVRGPAKRAKGLSRPLADPGRSLAVAVGGLHPLAIDTYRCPGCGYLESYAPDRPS
jgi:hypothetical protein